MSASFGGGFRCWYHPLVCEAAPVMWRMDAGLKRQIATDVDFNSSSASERQLLCRSEPNLSLRKY